MPWIYYILLLLIALAGLLMVIVTMPGLWLVTAAAAVFALLTHFHFIGRETLIALVVLSFAGELLELGAGGAAARRAGGGRRAMIGGAIGALLGGFFLTFIIPVPILGTIFGVCLGSFLGAAGLEMLGGKQIPHSLRIGAGAATGRFLGIIIKLMIGLAMLVLILIAGFPH